MEEHGVRVQLRLLGILFALLTMVRQGGGVEAQERTQDANTIRNPEDGIINQHRHRGSYLHTGPTHGERRSQGVTVYELNGTR
jgi:hypothetical protein